MVLFAALIEHFNERESAAASAAEREAVDGAQCSECKQTIKVSLLLHPRTKSAKCSGRQIANAFG